MNAEHKPKPKEGRGFIAFILIAIAFVVIVTACAIGARSRTDREAAITAGVDRTPNLAAAQPLSWFEVDNQKKVKFFQAGADPSAPVPLSKIEGVWWSDDATDHKAYAFLERADFSAQPYSAHLSLSNGVTLEVKCMLSHPPLRPDKVVMDLCDDLPIFTWVRVALSDVIENPDAAEWGMTYRASESSQVAEFNVTSICYANGSCMTGEEAGERAVARIMQRRKSGED
jgi:hypothetical protein